MRLAGFGDDVEDGRGDGGAGNVVVKIAAGLLEKLNDVGVDDFVVFGAGELLKVFHPKLKLFKTIG